MPDRNRMMLAVQVRHMPLEPGARTPGADAEAKTSSQAFGPELKSSYRNTERRCTRGQSRHPTVQSLLIRRPGLPRSLGWVRPGNFEEGSVYHHTVSRTLNSLFKVLFKFPSLYLFAIGLGVIFSLTRSLPRTLDCTLKQSDSGKRSAKPETPPYGPITLYGLWPLSSWTLTGV